MGQIGTSHKIKLNYDLHTKYTGTATVTTMVKWKEEW